MKKLFRVSLVLICLVSLAGCNSLTHTQERTLTGGAVGVAAGTVGTIVLGGCVACGAAIGGAVGAGTAYAIEKANEAIR